MQHRSILHKIYDRFLCKAVMPALSGVALIMPKKPQDPAAFLLFETIFKN